MRLQDKDFQNLVNYLWEHEDCLLSKTNFKINNVEDKLLSELVIKSLIPMAKHLGSTPDARSIGYLTICKCVKDIKKLKHVTAFSKYVGWCIYGQIRNYYNKEAKFTFYDTDDYAVIDYNIGYQLEFNELLDKYFKNIIEQTIVKSICEGYSNKDIAEQCNLSPQRICDIKNKIQERMKDLL